jgi:hypothetical protein
MCRNTVRGRLHSKPSWWYHGIMRKSTGDTTNPRKRRPPEPGTPIMVRLQREPLAVIDTWRRKQPDQPSRPEAIRRLVERGLKGK